MRTAVYRRKMLASGRRRPRRGVRRMRRRGGNAFTDFFTKTIPSGFKTAGNWIKDNKLVSRGLSFIPGVGGVIGSKVAGAVGLGRRRRYRRRRAPIRRRRGVGRRRRRAPIRRRRVYRRRGVGRRRVGRPRVRRYRRRRGGNLAQPGVLSRAHTYVKGNKLISKGLRALGLKHLGNLANIAGYGRRRRRRVVRRRRVYRR